MKKPTKNDKYQRAQTARKKSEIKAYLKKHMMSLKDSRFLGETINGVLVERIVIEQLDRDGINDLHDLLFGNPDN